MKKFKNGDPVWYRYSKNVMFAGVYVGSESWGHRVMVCSEYASFHKSIFGQDPVEIGASDFEIFERFDLED